MVIFEFGEDRAQMGVVPDQGSGPGTHDVWCSGPRAPIVSARTATAAAGGCATRAHRKPTVRLRMSVSAQDTHRPYGRRRYWAEQRYHGCVVPLTSGYVGELGFHVIPGRWSWRGKNSAGGSP